MSGIPDGTILTYTGTWTPTDTMGATSVISAVSSDLTGAGLPVRSSSNDAGLLQNTEAPFVLNLSPFHVTLTIQVQNGLGFAQISDVISIIRHWVFSETGAFPISDTVPTMVLPNTGNYPVDTGQPAPPQQPNNQQPGTGLFDSLSKALGDMFTGTTSAIGIVALIAIGGYIGAKKLGYL